MLAALAALQNLDGNWATLLAAMSVQFARGVREGRSTPFAAALMQWSKTCVYSMTLVRAAYTSLKRRPAKPAGGKPGGRFYSPQTII